MAEKSKEKRLIFHAPYAHSILKLWQTAHYGDISAIREMTRKLIREALSFQELRQLYSSLERG